MAVDRFRNSAQAPQTPHVKPDVQQAAVNENASQQPPPLATDGKRPEIGSPMYEVLNRRIVEHRNARQCHGGEHRNIDAENGLSDRHRTRPLPHPRRRFDSLDGRILAAFRSLILHAPLAKLLAEAEPWKLTTTLHAISHERLVESRAPRPAAKLLDGEMPVPPPGSAQPPRIHFTHIEYKEYEHYEFIFI